MSNRHRNRVVGLLPQRNGRKPKVESKPASDAVKLLWNEIMGPAQQAATAMNNVLNALTERTVQQAAKKDGVDLTTHVLNVETMEWVGRPAQGAINDNPAGHSSGERDGR